MDPLLPDAIPWVIQRTIPNFRERDGSGDDSPGGADGSVSAAAPSQPLDLRALAVDYDELSRRMGADLLRMRLMRQAEHVAEMVHQGRGIFRAERYIPVDSVIRRILKLTGLYWPGSHNYRNVQVVENTIRVSRLPGALEGLRILQISDLHIDLDPRLTPIVLNKLEGLEYDLAVVTGDYRNSTARNFYPALREMGRIIPRLKTPRYGILGNHDFIEMVPGLEAMGLPMLLNESVTLEFGGTPLHLAGVDDPAFYRTHNLAHACGDRPLNTLSILLAHSPDIYHQASVSCFDLVLCGHTHGGQICLPGGLPVVRNADCPGRMLSGNWEHKGLRGYTSRGTGGCGVPVRFFCPPEITVHTLRKN